MNTGYPAKRPCGEVCATCKNLGACEMAPPCAMKNLLTQSDTAFILWCLGYLLGLSDKMDQAHKKFILENHNIILSKIARLHEGLNEKKI